MEERERLVNQYCEAVAAYSEAVKKLKLLRGAEFDDAWARTEELHRICEGLRVHLENLEGKPRLQLEKLPQQIDPPG